VITSSHVDRPRLVIYARASRRRGADDDWASFYPDWLLDHSELPEMLRRAPTRSHLVHELVESERAFGEAAAPGRWQDFPPIG
jgi:hypothetical protein